MTTVLQPGPLEPEASLSRRRFLQLATLSAAGLAAGCAVNPVTGQSQLMLVSEDQEISIDRQNSPHQFSTDYGVCQDGNLNRYLQQTGQRLAAHTHRPRMPYRFNCVNATYVNAYAFPGGSIAATRGILLTLENEAELASLLGHELGHVNARHTAQQMTQGTLIQTLVGGLAAVAGTQGQLAGQLAGQLGMLGAGALLAGYSRDNEREADDLGLQYMTAAGYGADGFVSLMDKLRAMNRHNPSAIELMFATHPMSQERYQTAVAQVQGRYAAARRQPIYKERYMDHTAGLRRMRGAIEAMQEADRLMAKEQYANAANSLQTALRQAPSDYTALAMMAKCQMALQRPAEALRYAESAKQVYPQEAQARYLAGFTRLQQKQYENALADFNAYARLLPGNPNTSFFQGLSLEGMQRRSEAARAYTSYLKAGGQGNPAQHAYNRLVQWGYVRK
ncbi:MAG: M48 family metalloprotease [Desulfobacterales bacterium]|jgi:predicted Zn-dependent protease|nr:M48 family metalloprotease [Desulfobacterales bacterium]